MLVSLLQDADEAVRRQAALALKAIGGPGVDQLVIRLVTATGAEQTKLLHTLASMDDGLVRTRSSAAAPVLVSLLNHADGAVRLQAASLLEKIGVYAVQPLVTRLTQSTGAEQAQLLQALVSMGETTVPILNQIMIDTRAPLASRLQALTLVESLGEKGADAYLALV